MWGGADRLSGRFLLSDPPPPREPVYRAASTTLNTQSGVNGVSLGRGAGVTIEPLGFFGPCWGLHVANGARKSGHRIKLDNPGTMWSNVSCLCHNGTGSAYLLLNAHALRWTVHSIVRVTCDGHACVMDIVSGRPASTKLSFWRLRREWKQQPVSIEPIPQLPQPHPTPPVKVHRPQRPSVVFHGQKNAGAPSRSTQHGEALLGGVLLTVACPFPNRRLIASGCRRFPGTFHRLVINCCWLAIKRPCGEAAEDLESLVPACHQDSRCERCQWTV